MTLKLLIYIWRKLKWTIRRKDFLFLNKKNPQRLNVRLLEYYILKLKKSLKNNGYSK